MKRTGSGLGRSRRVLGISARWRIMRRKTGLDLMLEGLGWMAKPEQLARLFNWFCRRNPRLNFDFDPLPNKS